MFCAFALQSFLVSFHMKQIIFKVEVLYTKYYSHITDTRSGESLFSDKYEIIQPEFNYAINNGRWVWWIVKLFIGRQFKTDKYNFNEQQLIDR